MKGSNLLLFLVAALLIDMIGTCEGVELFAVGSTGMAIIDSATGMGVTDTNITWQVNSLAQDDEGRLFSIAQGTLVQIDPHALTMMPVLALKGLASATGLAFSNDGALFAVARSLNGLFVNDPLYRIDTATGQVSVVGDTGIYRIQGLACSPEGTLYGWSVSSGLGTIDHTTGQGQVVNPGLGAPAEIQALAFGPDGTLYGIRDALFRIDRATGIPVKVGSGGYSDIRGLGLKPTPYDPFPIRFERQGGNFVVYYYESSELQSASAVQGPWNVIESPSPYVEALTDAPFRFFRVVGRSPDPGATRPQSTVPADN